MKYAILLPAIGLVMVALAACADSGDGGQPPADVIEQPAEPAPQE